MCSFFKQNIQRSFHFMLYPSHAQRIPRRAINKYLHFIQPWHRDVPLAFTYETQHERMQKDKLLDRAETTAKTFFLFTCDLDLSIGSFQILKVEFLIWAIPKVMEFFEKLAKLVDPDLYKEMLTALHPQQKGD